MTERFSPYTWVTWITGILSGDKHCRYSAFVKTHYQYQKTTPTPDDDARLTKWKGEHADLVRARADALRADGWVVTVEGQNKFTLKGQSTTLAGSPDLIARKEFGISETDRGIALGGDLLACTPGIRRVARFEDAKTGAQRDSDHWQIRTYMLFAPMADARWHGYEVEGAVAYKEGLRPLPASAADTETRNRIVRLLKELGSNVVPPATPSVDECAFCDIAACPYRVTLETAPLQTEVF